MFTIVRYRNLIFSILCRFFFLLLCLNFVYLLCLVFVVILWWVIHNNVFRSMHSVNPNIEEKKKSQTRPNGINFPFRPKIYSWAHAFGLWIFTTYIIRKCVISHWSHIKYHFLRSLVHERIISACAFIYGR